MAGSKVPGAEFSYAKATGILGFITYVNILLSNIVPAAITGQFASYTLSAQSVLDYYDHAALSGILWYSGPVMLIGILFAIGLFCSLRRDAKSTGSELWLGAATAIFASELVLLVVASGIQWAMVSLDAQQSLFGVSVQGLYKVYVGIWYVMGDWLEGTWLFLFSLVIMKNRTFPRWISWVGLFTGAITALKTVPEAFGLGDVPLIFFPYLIGFSIWFVVVSVSLLREKGKV